MFVCLCNAITDKQIQQEIAEGAYSIDCLTKQLGVGNQCGHCVEHAKKMISVSTTCRPKVNTHLNKHAK